MLAMLEMLENEEDKTLKLENGKNAENALGGEPLVLLRAMSVLKTR